MEYSKEFKYALSQFSSLEKDRLIFRLLKKDKLLSKKLYFELIDEETTDDKRNQMECVVIDRVSQASKHLSNPKYFLMLIRKLSAEITEHVKVTTDKFGDVSLNLLLVNETLKNTTKLNAQRYDAVYKLHIYLLNKIVKALLLIKKLDEDYGMEFDTQLNSIEKAVHQVHFLEKIMINNTIDFDWLHSDRIPDDIDIRIKAIKSQGFLR